MREASFQCLATAVTYFPWIHAQNYWRRLGEHCENLWFRVQGGRGFVGGRLDLQDLTSRSLVPVCCLWLQLSHSVFFCALEKLNCSNFSSLSLEDGFSSLGMACKDKMLLRHMLGEEFVFFQKTRKDKGIQWYLARQVSGPEVEKHQEILACCVDSKLSQ